MNQRGFATLEVILMVMVIGILASIAVPRFTSITTSANTAKIQSDLSTIDTAIAIYYMENGKYPTNLKTDLKPYLNDIDNIKPPTGKAYISDGTTWNISGEYEITTPTGETEPRATLNGKTSGQFVKKSST